MFVEMKSVKNAPCLTVWGSSAVGEDDLRVVISTGAPISKWRGNVDRLLMFFPDAEYVKDMTIDDIFDSYVSPIYRIPVFNFYGNRLVLYNL